MSLQKLKPVLSISVLAILSATIFASCKKNSATTSTVDIFKLKYGYDSTSQVAKDSLVAYFPFNDSYTETVEGLNGTNTNTEFGPASSGVNSGLGTYYQGSSTAQSYVIYPSGTALPNLQSFTIVFWMNAQAPTLAGSGIVPGAGAQGLFTLVDSSQAWGNIQAELVPYVSPDSTAASSDTLELQVDLTSIAPGVVWQNQSLKAILPGNVGQWQQIIISYNGSTGSFTVYQNAAVISSLAYYYGPNTFDGATGYWPGAAELWASDPGDSTNPNAVLPLGNLQFPTNSATHFLIGSWQFMTSPSLTTHAGAQAGYSQYTGELDELRIYNAALSTAQINAIYGLQIVGR